jgi:transcriptional regulator with XRE-family HTH domain
MNRAELADFLRTRREAIQPEDVGLPRTRRRRTVGLRREEVADLSNMSTDYYSRIEQQRGPHPSEQMLAAIARALRLDPQQRDHLFHLAGYPPPQRIARTDHVNSGMSAIFERMRDTPAVIFNQLGETLAQNSLATVLLGDQTAYTGPHRALAYRWFTDPAERALFPERDHARHGRTIVAQLRGAQDRGFTDPRVHALVGTLRGTSPEFAQIWSEHPVSGPHCAPKRIEHPRLGTLDLHGQILLDPDQSQLLTVFTAPPDSESYDKLRHLAEHLV